MPRPIWTGTISFGLVNVPVKLFTATESKDVSFHQLQRDTGDRIRYRRVAESTGEEVPYEEIVKGYEIDGTHVIVEPDELEALQPEKSRAIEISEFVDLDDVDPVHFQKTYYVAPASEDAAKAYSILRRAMAETNRAGVATFVMRGKEHLAAVRPMDGVLALETMFFADEVRPAGAIDELDRVPDDDAVSDRERKMAVQLVESLTEEWDPTRYRDTHREQVLDLIQRKAEGEDVVAAAPAAEPQAEVVDLMAALEASVQEARQGRPAASGSGAEGDEDVQGRSKEELYEAAQRHDIPGRSKMSKDELADALRQAS